MTLDSCRVKEAVAKPKESDDDVTELNESSSVQKKSRLDTDDDLAANLGDDGKIWSKPLPETRDTSRCVTCLCLLFIARSLLLFREDEFDEYFQSLFP